MMNYYIYDGSFPGLLTAIYTAFYTKESPDKIITYDYYQKGLFDKVIKIETDVEKSDRVYQAIKEKISLYSLKKIYNVYLSEGKNTAYLIYKYLRIGFKIGKKIDNYLNNDIVDRVEKISSRVNKEKHLILGLLRFKKTQGGIFYAPFEPDYNIVSLIAPHFSQRLSDQNWIIHDKKREIAAVYNKEEWLITEMDNPDGITYAAEELFYQKLWQGFYNSISITDRENPVLQRQFMPRRYWKYLIEK